MIFVLEIIAGIYALPLFHEFVQQTFFQSLKMHL